MTEHGICAKCKKSVGCLYADDRITGCKKFVLEPELELTNEEWFCNLSTEEKAKWMAKHMSFCEVCEIQTCRGDGCRRFDRESMTETDAFREWLKEKHDGNMGKNP